MLLSLSVGASQPMAYTGEGQKTLLLKCGSEGHEKENMSAAGIAVAYALLLGWIVYRELNGALLFQVLKNSAMTTASIAFWIAGPLPSLHSRESGFPKPKGKKILPHGPRPARRWDFPTVIGLERLEDGRRRLLDPFYREAWKPIPPLKLPGDSADNILEVILLKKQLILRPWKIRRLKFRRWKWVTFGSTARNVVLTSWPMRLTPGVRPIAPNARRSW